MSFRKEALKHTPSDLWLWNIVAKDHNTTTTIATHTDNEKNNNNNNNDLQQNDINHNGPQDFKVEEEEEKKQKQQQLQQPQQPQVWIKKNSFELKYRIEPSPFFHSNRIIFAADHSGIYEYNNSNDRCKFIYRFTHTSNAYSPTQYSYIYNELSNEILFIGGRSADGGAIYDIIMIYNLNTKRMTQMSLNNNCKKIGTNPKMILINGRNLHIIGGSHNKYHLLYDLRLKMCKCLYQLPYPNGLMYHGLLYCRSQSTLILFGGIYYNNCTASIRYNSDFWMFNLLNNEWNKIIQKKLPLEISGFGYVLYNDGVILIFGGKICGDESVNSIYYMDILHNNNGGWVESEIKCPLAGGYHAILELDVVNHENDCVHLFYCAGNKEHFLININDIFVDNVGVNMCYNQNNNEYSAVWIDKCKLTAKSRIECTPFCIENSLNNDCSIMYSAEYNIYDASVGGIYEYCCELDMHRLVSRFSTHKYYPSGHTCIYNMCKSEIIFIGGKNVENNRKPYESMMIYDMSLRKMTRILFKRAIGSDPKLLLINNYNSGDLHIIGGSHNTYHLCYNLNSNELSPIYPLPYSNGLSGHGLIYCCLNDSIITFGGAYYDYISCSYQFCNDYWMYSCLTGKYRSIYHKILPQTINGFGYILFANRILITFGGSIQRNKFIDNIYYTDTLNLEMTWKESKIKCPKKGGYHAILLKNTIVHLIHFGKEQFEINIKHLLPKSMHLLLLSQPQLNIIPKLQVQNIQSININLKQLLHKYENKIHILQCENHQLKMDNNMFKSQMYAFQQDRKEKEFTIAKLQKNIKQILLLSNSHNSYNSYNSYNSFNSSHWKLWNLKQIIDWIINLENKRFHKYENQLNKLLHQIVENGENLKYLTEQELQSIIDNDNDTCLLYKYIQLLLQN